MWALGQNLFNVLSNSLMVFISAWECSRPRIRPESAGSSLHWLVTEQSEHSDFFFPFFLSFAWDTGRKRNRGNQGTLHLSHEAGLHTTTGIFIFWRHRGFGGIYLPECGLY